MKILWFTHIPMPAVNRHTRYPVIGTGHWMPSLLTKLSGQNGIELGVATASPGFADMNFRDEGVEYFVAGQGKRKPVFCFTDLDARKSNISKCVHIIEKWKPDLVHIHGTERFYGLLSAKGYINVPTIISIQGLLGPCSQWSNFFGALSHWEIIKSHRFIALLAGRGLILNYQKFKKDAKRELDIISGNDTFAGRTLWDQAHIRSINPDASYFHVGEILRESFYKANWSLSKCDRHSIIFTNAGHPMRGVETLLEAIRILRNEFPDTTLRIAGNISQRGGYGRFVRRRIEQIGLGNCVNLLGYIDAETMAGKLCKSHVFAISSYIENSPNSLCEAMLVGMPCAASYAGGIPSLVEEGKTGLFFPPGDAAVLAGKIRQIFLDDDLAVRLGSQARLEAMKRHSPEQVVNQLLTAYRKVIANHSMQGS